MDGALFDAEDLVRIANTRMPFGKYQGMRLINLPVNLPEPCLLWFAKKEFPHGQLGRLMELTLAFKVDGLEGLVRPLINNPDSAT